MSSLFDSIFDDYASPALMNFHGDPTDAVYDPNDGGATVNLKVIKQDVTTVKRTTDGRELKMTTCVIHVHRDPDGAWGGIADVNQYGKFTFDGITWAVNNDEGDGIVNQTPTFHSVSVKQIKSKGQAAPEARRRL